MPPTSKAEWRIWARSQPGAMPQISALVCGHLAAFLHAQGARVVLAYRALSGEVDLSALAADFTLLTPRAHFGSRQLGTPPCLSTPPRLSLHAWASATQLSRFGALEPPPGTPEVPLSAVDTVLLPGLAFDLCGVRLGYGGGFYDRLLASWSGRTVGVSSRARIVEALPREAHDQAAQWLATEDGVERVCPA